MKFFKLSWMLTSFDVEKNIGSTLALFENNEIFFQGLTSILDFVEGHLYLRSLGMAPVARASGVTLVRFARLIETLRDAEADADPAFTGTKFHFQDFF